MSKFVVYSDLHMHNWEYGSSLTVRGINSRLEQQSQFLISLGKYCKEHHIKDAFFCGDFFHTHGKLSVEVMSMAYNAMRYNYAQGLSQYLLVGNHDVAKKFLRFPAEPNSLQPFSMLASIVSSPMIGRHLSYPNITVSMIPFIEDPAKLEQLLKEVGDVKTIHPHYLFLHQGVSQVPIGSGYLLDESLTVDMIPDNVTRAFAGHYHVHRDLGKLVIVGPPMQHTWADKDQDGGVLIVDSETGEFVREHIYSSPKFVELDASFISLIAKLGDNANIINLISNNFIRINNIESSEEEATKAKNLLLEVFGAASVELNFTARTQTPLSNISSNLSVEELLAELSKTLTPKEKQIGEQLRAGNYEI